MTGWREPMLTRESRLPVEASTTHGGARGHGSAIIGGHSSTVQARHARSLAVLLLLMLSVAALRGQTTPTYQIQSASPASAPAGAAGATIALSGTLPDFTQGTYQVCF